MKDIDRLFGDTLANHASPPSSGLWERVEASLPVPGHSTTWMRWAAVLIPALVAAGIWMSLPSDTTHPIATKTSAPALQPVAKSPVTTEVVEKAPVAQATPKKKSSPKVMVTSAPITEEIPEAVVDETVAFEDLTIEPVILDQEVAVIAEAPKPLVIVYTLETVATETPVDMDRNALDRVVDFARTVKHSDPIGDIRGFKDELFALDLRKKQSKKN